MNDQTTTHDANERRMTCIVCRGRINHGTATVCHDCSRKLRDGQTLESPRTYCMPNCVDTAIKFRIRNDRMEWAFADESYRFGPCEQAELTPRPDTPLLREWAAILALVAAAALALHALPAYAQTPDPRIAAAVAASQAEAAPLPAGCTITGHTSEGFPVASCEDGSRIYQDLDGQPYPNAAGNPVYPAGTWVAME